MRTLIVILLSVIFSLNAAFAAVAGVCDAIDHLPQGGSEQHFHVDQHSQRIGNAQKFLESANQLAGKSANTTYWK